MKLNAPKMDPIEINLTPLIDVVFLLLIFFMVSTTFTQKTQLAIDLPEAVGNPAKESPKQLVIAVSNTGQYAVNGHNLSQVTATGLVKAIQSFGATAGQVVVITADAQASHQSVITLMDWLGQSGFNNIRLATKKPAQPQ